MNSEVIELYDSNFDELVLKAEGLWIIEIYSPTCSHCKNLEEDWKILSESLRGSESQIHSTRHTTRGVGLLAICLLAYTTPKNLK